MLGRLFAFGDHLLEHGNFRIHAALEVFEKADAAEGQTMRIGGICTTSKLDKQSERVIQQGLDFSPFLASGWFNDNHGQKTKDVVGYPTDARFVRKGQMLPTGRPAKQSGWWTEGYLLDTDVGRQLYDVCRSLQNTPRRLGFSIEGKVTGRQAGDPKTITKAVVKNVAVTHCFPGDTYVSGAVESITRRKYDGPVVKIELKGGYHLTGTPNHPVLTDMGWVPMGELRVGEHRVACHTRYFVSRNRLPVPSRTLVVPHEVDHVPTSLEQLFDLSLHSGNAVRSRPILEGDFHGDVLQDGKVSIVRANGFLKAALDSAFFQQFGEEPLTAADLGLRGFTSLGKMLSVGWRNFLATASCVSRSGHLAALFGAPSAVPQQLLFAPGPGHSGSFHDFEDRLTTHPESFGLVGRTLPRDVVFNDLRTISVSQFTGHVYNLQTEQNWYSANGVVAHNCPVNTDTEMIPLAKALTAGAAIAVEAIATGPGDGSPLRQESLDTGPYDAGGHYDEKEDVQVESLDEDDDDLATASRGGWAGENVHKAENDLMPLVDEAALLTAMGPHVKAFVATSSDPFVFTKSEAEEIARERFPHATHEEIAIILNEASQGRES